MAGARPPIPQYHELPRICCGQSPAWWGACLQCLFSLLGLGALYGAQGAYSWPAGVIGSIRQLQPLRGKPGRKEMNE